MPSHGGSASPPTNTGAGGPSGFRLHYRRRLLALRHCHCSFDALRLGRWSAPPDEFVFLITLTVSFILNTVNSLVVGRIAMKVGVHNGGGSGGEVALHHGEPRWMPCSDRECICAVILTSRQTVGRVSTELTTFRQRQELITYARS